MPPKQASGGARGRPKGSKNKRSSTTAAALDSPESSDPFDSPDEQAAAADDDEDAGNRRRTTKTTTRRENNNSGGTAAQDEEAEGEAEKTIPRELLTRVLHEFFAKDATRISRDANAAVGKYVDVFVREAIARAAVDKRSGFLEVDDLEKIAPQLLLDL
ncbi:hypothetical protein JDV02_006073 [Purpureocillium takamizusanense]|uniref:Centromere protein X n=1 Tax=Purpureocillium takamizusanense TaxID=2060973 RepID=A0A9Q8QIS8_9HYPO|nr:uncharacterized protein JDV02_006073 [Purpureocillium takamizusanense]UNI19931.1 hypothetical protein JDV02_006073 [Purpureocillium takamizusanense]